MRDEPSTGPLSGVRVVEMASMGPVPFAGMVLADLGAAVTRIDRAGNVLGPPPAEASPDLLGRGRRSIAIDVKDDRGVEVVRRLAADADVLLEGFRPGVMERLGLGPEQLTGANPGLIYGRGTGWGQAGPMMERAGHDINYVAVSGALHGIGRAGEPPVPPLNLVGDFGGGGMLLAVGVLAALVERAASGCGQVIDAAMVDGSALLTTVLHGLLEMGEWRDQRGSNLLDGSAPFYDVYETADGQYLAVGAIEPAFYAAFLRVLGLDGDLADQQFDRSSWPFAKERIAEVLRTRSRDEWCAIFDGMDACVSPVLSLCEAPAYEHNSSRGSFVTVGGLVQPAPAPRFSRTPGAITRPPPHPGQHSSDVLAAAGYSDDESADLIASGVVR